MNHQFNVHIAKEYGVDEAILLSNLVFWQVKNQANRKHEYDGRFWTYNSMRAFSELFPYWTEKQIRRILSNLEESKCIKSANYNKIGYDRTKWYSVEPFILDICLNGQMDLTKRADGFDQKGEPIPDIKPVDKTNEYIESCIARIRKSLPREMNKTVKVAKDKLPKLIKQHGEDDLIKAVNNYIQQMKKDRVKFPEKSYMNESTFWNGRYEDFINIVDEPQKETKKVNMVRREII